MKRLIIASAAIATLVAGAGAGFAASAQEYRHDRQEVRQDRREIRRDRQELRHDQRGQSRHWRQGERLDSRYGSYEEVDWRAHRLSAPRRGYHWVRSGDDYVQAALVGGLIATAIAANR